MNQQVEAMKLALEALEHLQPTALTSFYTIGNRNKAITALQKALAQPQQEPVAAECKFDREEKWVRCEIAHHNLVQSEPEKWPGYQTRLLYTSHQPARQQEPVGWLTQARNFVHLMEFTEEEAKLYGWEALYTSSPARKPLTDAEKRELIKKSELWDMHLHVGWYSAPSKSFVEKAIQLIADIEAAHNIKGDA